MPCLVCPADYCDFKICLECTNDRTFQRDHRGHPLKNNEEREVK